MKILASLIYILVLAVVPTWAAESGAEATSIDLTSTTFGYIAIILFIAAYSLVILEEKLHLRKSKPVLLAAGVIWILLAVMLARHGDTHTAREAIKHNLLEYAELMLFLLVAMTYINSMEERNIFQKLRVWLISTGFSLRGVFWVTGVLSFCISPIADNLTTALLMGAVVMAVGGNKKRFIALACINIVVAANAGGAFSPFGDITTLMVWQKGIVQFSEFFAIFLPSLVNWLIPAAIMNFAVGKESPEEIRETIQLKLGAYSIIILFLLTIVTAVAFHSYLNLPPAAGMMLGLGYLGFFSYYIKRKEQQKEEYDGILGAAREDQFPRPKEMDVEHFDLMRKIARVEWDTLLFFYGIILCVGGLSQFGYLGVVSTFFYHDLGPTVANIMVGVRSAIVDNIPVMFAVLTMNPNMVHGQWLLVTLTAGVGGSLLSIGSAAGVALMGTARGTYTFSAHLRWVPAIALGYSASIIVHMMVNAKHF